MEKEDPIEVWDLWYPKAAATGIPFARCKIDPQEVLLVHAAPEVLSVTVSSSGRVKAEGQNLQATQDSPMTRLRCNGDQVEREDIWPDEGDIGRIVVLPGGEAGVLRKWWHAGDHSEWRWEVAFYNRK